MAQRIDIRTGSLGGYELSPEFARKMRKLLIIGATRGTGKQVLEQALAAGHPVVALAREPTRVEVSHDLPSQRLSVLRGDVLDPTSLAAAMTDCDAVISTIGVASRVPTTLYSDGMRNIIEAMHSAGVGRLIAVSASPLSDDAGDTWPSRLLLMPLIRALLRPVYADMARMEDELRHSDLDWTIVRPPKLTDKPRRGSYRTAWNRKVRGGYTIGRADLAAAILTFLDDRRTIRAAIDIAY